MSLIVRMRKQDACYWPPPTPDGYGGGTFQYPPTDIKVRWEDKTALIFNEQGQQETTTTQVYVGFDAVKGGYLWLGKSTDLDSGDDDPREIAGAVRIRQFDKTPNMKATEFLRVARCSSVTV